MIEQLSKELRTYADINNYFGMLRITRKDEPLLRINFGYADKEKKIPFTEESMFSLYSLSKPFCAIGTMKLYEQGALDVDKHPACYVPEAAGFDSRVTLRHMLHHVSGVPDFELNDEFSEKHKPGYAYKAREHLKLLAEYPSYFIPGTDVKYANVNMIVCALAIENVTGCKYAEYMRKEVFEPLGMPHAIVDDEKKHIDNRVTGYKTDGKKIVPVEKSHNWLFGAGDIVATVDDVYCLNRAIKHEMMLKKDTWRQILTPHPVCHFGMGVSISEWHGRKRITHNGGCDGFRTLHIQLPDDDFDLIFLSNSGYGNARNEISEMVYSAIYGKDDQPKWAVEMDKGYI